MEITDGKQNAHKELLEKFKNNLSDVLMPAHTDTLLMKFLRAGNLNLKNCEKLFRVNLATRAVHKVDNYWMESIPEVFEKYAFTALLGLAKDGTPVRYIDVGKGDMYGFILSASTYDICRFCSMVIEQDFYNARKDAEKTGKEINEGTYILDMNCFSLRACFYTSVIEMAFDLFRMVQDLYPEVWRHVLVINAAYYFYQAFNIVRPIFRETLLKNIIVVSKENTPAILLKYIDADVIPAFLGGTRVDSTGDPMCLEFIKFGTKIPEEYYLKHRPTTLLLSDPGVKGIWIRAGSFYNHAFVVREAGSRFHIEIRTEGGSITITLMFRELGSFPDQPDIPPCNVYLNEHDPKCNIRQISPCLKVQTHLSPVDYNHSYAPWPGIYVMRFENSNNWMTSRQVIFRISASPPCS